MLVLSALLSVHQCRYLAEMASRYLNWLDTSDRHTMQTTLHLKFSFLLKMIIDIDIKESIWLQRICKHHSPEEKACNLSTLIFLAKAEIRTLLGILRTSEPKLNLNLPAYFIQESKKVTLRSLLSPCKDHPLMSFLENPGDNTRVGAQKGYWQIH